MKKVRDNKRKYIWVVMNATQDILIVNNLKKWCRDNKINYNSMVNSRKYHWYQGNLFYKISYYYTIYDLINLDDKNIDNIIFKEYY